MADIVDIPYKPRRWARDKLHSSFKRFFSLIIHRRGGKTTALVNHMIRAATDDKWEKKRLLSLMPSLSSADLRELLKNRLYGIVFPTYSQAELVTWEMLKFYSAPFPGLKTNEVDLEVRFPNDNRVRLFGADKPHRMRGPAFWGLAFDEYSQQRPNTFSEVLSKSLADHLGFAIFAGTIKGKNQLFRTHEVAKNNPAEWDYIWQDIEGSFRNEEGVTIELLRRALEDDRKLVAQGMMTEEEFQQEWYLSVEAAIKGAIYAKELALARKEGRVGIVPYDTAQKVHTVWDLGKGRNMAVGFYQQSFGQIRKIDYWEGSGDESLPQAIKVLKDKPYVYGKHFAPHDIEAVDMSTGVTRRATARRLGIDFIVVPNIPIEEGINAGKLAFSRLWVSEQKCMIWLDTIAQYRREWDERRGMFKDNPLHDWTSHGADEWRYAAIVSEEMTNEEEKSYTPTEPKWMEP